MPEELTSAVPTTDIMPEELTPTIPTIITADITLREPFIGVAGSMRAVLATIAAGAGHPAYQSHYASAAKPLVAASAEGAARLLLPG